MTLSQFNKILLFVASGALLASCGSEPSTTDTPKASETVTETSVPTPVMETQTEKTLAAVKVTTDTTTPTTPTSSASSSSTTPEQAALLKRGRIVWFKCRSCHEVSVEGPHKVGPNLNGLMGAKAGVKEGFKFSEAFENSDIIWTDETLDAFVTKPTNYIPGTKMAFVGIKKESDRAALIAYIKENTQPPQ